MLDTEVTSAILKSVDDGFDEQLAFTQDLVRLPSLRGEEHTAQDFMADAMRKRAFDVDHWLSLIHI